jgi:hypothetical protein
MNSPAPRYFFTLGDGPRFGAVHGAIEQPFGPHASQDGRGHDSDAGMAIAGHRLHAIPVWQAHAAHAPAHASFGPCMRPGPVRPPLAIWGR